MPSPPAGLAVFDLDGTITYHDTLAQFIVLAARARPARLARGWRLLAPALDYALRRDRGRLKGAVIAALLRDTPRAQIDMLAERLVSGLRPHGLYPGALAAIERHRRAGDRLVLLSASPDLYVPHFARALGFDECMCTPVRWDGGRLIGTLAGENCRGEEKARLVAQLIDRLRPGRSAAYGNAASDLAHLRLVDAPLLVNASRAARRAATGLGIPTADWR